MKTQTKVRYSLLAQSLYARSGLPQKNKTGQRPNLLYGQRFLEILKLSLKMSVTSVSVMSVLTFARLTIDVCRYLAPVFLTKLKLNFANGILIEYSAENLVANFAKLKTLSKTHTFGFQGNSSA